MSREQLTRVFVDPCLQHYNIYDIREVLSNYCYLRTLFFDAHCTLLLYASTCTVVVLAYVSTVGSYSELSSSRVVRTLVLTPTLIGFVNTVLFSVIIATV